ncbi:MAG: dTDP-4-dehydrorhamnose 3,5-epimerase [Puniceicoccales bacterium]|jgi:dTDP-4-dehydrorhamnose 3,5-epimerase|nr:dTDP-4-dehydrorhamnose 3,5-epimerase [Puniceicoccales bacterium]
MEFAETEIAGVYVITPKVFFDGRGYFFESYNWETFHKTGIDGVFVQDNQSLSTYGVIRGLHCQLGKYAQGKLVRVLRGKILDVAADIRRESPTYGQHVAVELSDENKKQLFIPRGFVHGFSTLSEETVVAYKCDNEYNRAAELGIAFDDPDLAIDWQIPPEKMILSPRDREHGRLRDVVDNG